MLSWYALIACEAHCHGPQLLSWHAERMQQQDVQYKWLVCVTIT